MKTISDSPNEVKLLNITLYNFLITIFRLYIRKYLINLYMVSFLLFVMYIRLIQRTGRPCPYEKQAL